MNLDGNLLFSHRPCIQSARLQSMQQGPRISGVQTRIKWSLAVSVAARPLTRTDMVVGGLLQMLPPLPHCAPQFAADAALSHFLFLAAARCCSFRWNSLQC